MLTTTIESLGIDVPIRYAAHVDKIIIAQSKKMSASDREMLAGLICQLVSVNATAARMADWSAMMDEDARITAQVSARV